MHAPVHLLRLNNNVGQSNFSGAIDNNIPSNRYYERKALSSHAGRGPVPRSIGWLQRLHHGSHKGAIAAIEFDGGPATSRRGFTPQGGG